MNPIPNDHEIRLEALDLALGFATNAGGLNAVDIVEIAKIFYSWLTNGN